jgi:hypothetical protein
MSGWVNAFIVIAGLAILLQTIILSVMAIQMKSSVERLLKLTNDLHSRVDPILARTARILDDSEDRISSIMGDAAEITRIARGQAQKVDRVFTDAVERLRLQVIHADQILTGTLEVVEDAGSKFKRNVWMPIQQASALLKGLKAGLEFLRSSNRPKSDAVQQDEELFI